MLISMVVINLSLQLNAFAQEEAETFKGKNVVFAEVGGSALRYAISYGRVFEQKGRLKLSGSAGFSMWYYNTSSFAYRSSTLLPALPVEFTALWGRSKHHLEIGIGITPSLGPAGIGEPGIPNRTRLTASVPLRIGYRYQKPEGGFFFRFGYTPVIEYYPNSESRINLFPLWAGISLGKSF